MNRIEFKEADRHWGSMRLQVQTAEFEAGQPCHGYERQTSRRRSGCVGQIALPEFRMEAPFPKYALSNFRIP